MKIGDRVRIVKRNLDKQNYTKRCFWNDEMDEYIGRTFTIKEITEGGYAHYDTWVFISDWLEPIEKINARELNKQIYENRR